MASASSSVVAMSRVIGSAHTPQLNTDLQIGSARRARQHGVQALILLG